MATSTTTTGRTGAAAEFDTDVILVGAGPVGLSIANMLALRGASSIVLEQLDTLIDYPRAVGIDDEALRSVQAMGLIDAVLPHTAPNHIMRIVNGRGGVLAEMAPATDEFGWSRRNAFVQPLVDEELYKGLARFDNVEVRFSQTVKTIEDLGDRVVATVADADGQERRITAKYLVGTDGGRSMVRKWMGVDFDGMSAPTRWLVVDLRKDPLGTSNVFLGGDPRRPYVSIALPGAIRRFEFMLFDDEPDEIVEDNAFISKLLAKHVPNPADIDPIRRRVYTHHSRVASDFRKGRVLIAGDAAHLMPVWQGQGYNSGLRDATNLGWKLAAVVSGACDDALLDTYTAERKDHAKAMVDLSTTFGKIVKPTNRFVTGLRDASFAVLNRLPSAKAYFVQMKYKPMPRYTEGVVVDASTLAAGRSDGRIRRQLIANLSANTDVSPVGTQFIQPQVTRPDGSVVRLDEVLGIHWAVLVWNSKPEEVFDEAELAELARLGAKLVTARPMTQFGFNPSEVPGAEIVGDTNGTLKRWFDDRPTPVLFLRPDRFIAAATLIQDAPTALQRVIQAVHLRPAQPKPARVPRRGTATRAKAAASAS